MSDPWSAEPYPAGPIQPLIKEYVPPKASDAPSRASGAQELNEYELGPIRTQLSRFADLVVEGWGPSPAVVRLVQRLEGPESFILAAGFIGGTVDGATERLADWLHDSETLLQRLRKLLIEEEGRVKIGKAVTTGIATSLLEFFVRPLSNDVIEAGKLSPVAEAAVAELKLLHDLDPIFALLKVLEDGRRAVGFLAQFETLAQGIVLGLLQVGRQEVQRVLFEDDVYHQGELIGEFVGAGVVELVRAIVEPPELTVAELVSLLALDQQEWNELLRQSKAP